MARRNQHGGIVVVAMIVTALLAGAAALLAMQMTSTKAGGMTRAGLTGLYCAEAGLAAARPLVTANVAGWSAVLCNPPPPRGTGTCVIGSAAAEPIWLRSPALNHDLDGDSVGDFMLTLVDNHDEAVSDPTTDSDQQVFIISTCVKHPDMKAEVSELVRFDPMTGKLSRKLWQQSE